MSIPFNLNSSDSLGLVQLYEKEVHGGAFGHVSGNTQRLRNFTAEANIALDELFELAHSLDGVWQFDDTNHSDWPDHTVDLVSGTRRYAVTADSDSNEISEIYRAFVKDSGGTFHELKRVDQQSEDDTNNFWDGNDNGGVPYRFDLTGKWADLDPVPDYNSTGGLKLFISRGPHYFTVSDTTETAGVPSFLHPYLYLRPAEHEARRGGLVTLPSIQMEIEKLKRQMTESLSRRTMTGRMSPAQHSNK